ncbi:MAG: acyl-CoA dehydrogenase family protein [Chloroflexi bacterium]|nr:acyl-CoA dehydrogenase family protein [Chloroflexota bacterium]
MDFGMSEREEGLRQEVRDFLRRELPPGWQGMDGDEALGDGVAVAKELTRKLARSGWLTMAWPKEYGGQGRGFLEQAVYQEETAYQRVPMVSLDAGIGGVKWIGPSLMLFGTEEQKREHLPRIGSGERYWCTLYSEPGSGSDLASLQTRAARDGDDYVVNGSKIWNTSAHVADWAWLACRTDPAAAKHKGISVLLVDMRSPGVSLRPIHNMAGGHEFNQVFLDNVRVPRQNLVGEQDRGWYVVAAALDFERSGIGSSAEARRNLDDLAAHVREQGPLATGAPVRHRLAELTIEGQVARGLAYNVAWLQSQGKVPNREASASKLFGSELVQRVAQAGMELLGLYGGLVRGSRWAALNGRFARAYLASFSSTIAGGTSEVQRNIIAQRGLGLPRG